MACSDFGAVATVDLYYTNITQWVATRYSLVIRFPCKSHLEMDGLAIRELGVYDSDATILVSDVFGRTELTQLQLRLSGCVEFQVQYPHAVESVVQSRPCWPRADGERVLVDEMAWPARPRRTDERRVSTITTDNLQCRNSSSSSSSQSMSDDVITSTQ